MERPTQLDDLGIFVRVVEHKSMSAAARRLGVPKSTISRAIARLEDGLSVRLLQRTTRALAPTDAGAALYAEVLPHVEALRSATSVVTSESETPRGLLRVTAPNDLAAQLLPEILARFVKRYPEVQVELVLTARTVDLIGESIDLAIRAGVLKDSSLVAKKLRDSEAHVYAAPAYLATRGTPKTPGDLESHECIVFRAQNGRGRWTLESKSEKVVVTPAGRLSADDFSFIVGAVIAGSGIALLPRFLAAPGLADGRLVRVLPAFVQKVGAMYAVHASTRHVPRKIAVLRDFLVEAFESLPSI
jgi:DNA-binding transcriptional LysR family regulator